MTLPSALKLEQQKEIIERWLDIPGIPNDARQRLSEMLAEVKEDMQRRFPVHDGVRKAG